MRRLLIRPGAIGDFVTSLPALESLCGSYTEVWCSQQNVPLAGFADSALSIGASGIDRLGVLAADDVIARFRQFDDIVSWYGANRPEFRDLTRHLGLPFRFCTALPAGRHAVDFYNAQAQVLEPVTPAAFPRILTPPVMRTFGVIHPFASSPGKRLPTEWFEQINSQLSVAMPLHWLAGPGETLPREHTRIENLYELACWLAGARVFVGNDSGISHLAAAVGTPVLCGFQSTDPRVWSPRGLAWTFAKSAEKFHYLSPPSR